jgi:hypothetical protein
MCPFALFQAGIVISVAASGESIKIILFSIYFILLFLLLVPVPSPSPEPLPEPSKIKQPGFGRAARNGF